MDEFLKQPLKELGCKGVGPKKQLLLAELGINTVYDVLMDMPRTYKEIPACKGIKEFSNGDTVVLHVQIIGQPSQMTLPDGRRMTSVLAGDMTGKVRLVWYNSPWAANNELIKRSREYGDEITVIGKFFQSFNRFSIAMPELHEVSDSDYEEKLEPVYSLKSGLNNADRIRLVDAALKLYGGRLSDPLPASLRSKLGLPEFNFAIINMHRPVNAAALEDARKRLAFDELFMNRLVLNEAGNRRRVTSDRLKLEITKAEVEEFLRGLPYKPTGAQLRAIDDICRDSASGFCMNRLLEGDVGSGKTLVAAFALYAAATHGMQAVLLAPTSILAYQHSETLSEMLGKYGIKVGFLKGGMKSAERRELLAGLSTGTVQVAVGTHALLNDDIEFKSLALVVTDEQHRFGVRQRGAALGKTETCHSLVMSATPIPRSLNLVLFGDLDISVLDELPAGRKPVQTLIVSPKDRDRIYASVKNKVLTEGTQVYIVAPRVEDSEESTIASAVGLYEALCSGALSGLAVGLIHGRLKQEEKDALMDSFSSGALQVLVSTTVIEVGVNVPNANIMVIEGADRFGLAQLHQLRGRIGRGSKQAVCLLMPGELSPTALERLKIIKNTQSGFEIAEKDLELRGSGDYLGTRQHGVPAFRRVRLPEDTPILERANYAALHLTEFCSADEIAILKEELTNEFGRLLDATVMN